MLHASRDACPALTYYKVGDTDWQNKCMRFEHTTKYAAKQPLTAPVVFDIPALLLVHGSCEVVV